jgi:proteasome lid subunit RPN8/RPN11
MTEQDELNYAAQITISLPNSEESVTLTVTLWPADIVDLDGKLKPLRDCTLADLERYAEALQADVWDAYEAIFLPELDAEEDVRLEVRLINEDAQGPEDWREFNLLLPLEDPQSAGTAVVKDESEDAEEEQLAEEQEATSEEAAEDETEIESDGADESGDPDVAVAEAELVYPEIEDEIAAEVAAAEIIPSQARVRVAGGRLPLGNSTWAAVDILMDEPALRAAQAHALSSLNREVAGVLIGSRPEKQPDGRYVVHIFDTIEAQHTVMQGASVTYTPESWRYLNDTLAEKYPDDTAVMVGWYHTHPGFGIFLSGMDLFIHQNFFTQVWHVAMVLDPRARTSGFFCWDRHKTEVKRCDFAWPPWAAGSW